MPVSVRIKLQLAALAFFLSSAVHSQSINVTGSSLFPGIKGYGSDSRGGYGGRIIRVNTLARNGAGSLAEAIRATGPRIVVFDVAGIIDLEWRSLGIINPYITIAGHTAPYPGITLIRGGINIGTHDVIIQHLKVRPGAAGRDKNSGWEVDGISTVDGAYNVIIDHCSITWATDENLSASGPQFQGNTPEEWRKNTSHKIIFSNCIIAEALSNSTHSKGEHSKGSLIHDNVTEVLIINNLYASNVDRNPLFSGGTTGAVVNNLISNPGQTAILYARAETEWAGKEPVKGAISVVGNVIESGPDTRRNINAGYFRGLVDVFWDDNKIVAGPEARALTGEFSRTSTPSAWPPGLEAMPSQKVREFVLENAGAFPWQRDEIDQRIIDNARNRTTRVINSENEVGGYPVNNPVMRKFEDGQ